MFQLIGRMKIGRMRVEPGSTPTWEDGRHRHRGHRGFHRGGYRGLEKYGRNSFANNETNMLTPEEKSFQEEVRINIEEILLLKFKKMNEFSEIEKKGIQMTIMAQIKGHSKVIFEEACYRVENNKKLQEEMESMTEEQIEEILMEKISKEAKDIALDEFEFDCNIDINQFMKREKQVKDRIENGELTIEEAYKILKEPIIVENEELSNSQKYEEIYRAYNQSEKTMNNPSTQTDKCAEFRKLQYVPPEKREKVQHQEDSTDGQLKKLDQEITQ